MCKKKIKKIKKNFFLIWSIYVTEKEYMQYVPVASTVPTILFFRDFFLFLKRQ